MYIAGKVSNNYTESLLAGVRNRGRAGLTVS